MLVLVKNNFGPGPGPSPGKKKFGPGPGPLCSSLVLRILLFISIDERNSLELQC